MVRVSAFLCSVAALNQALFGAAQKISADGVPSINSSVVANYVRARTEYIASEAEQRQGRRISRLATNNNS